MPGLGSHRHHESHCDSATGLLPWLLNLGETTRVLWPSLPQLRTRGIEKSEGTL